MKKAPTSAFFLVFLFFLTEDYSNFIEITASLSTRCWFLLFMTAVCAFGVNLSTYYIVGKTSSLTYNIVSQGKTASLFAGGVFLFGDSFTGFQMIGLFIAAIGIFFYTKDNMNKQKTKNILPINEEK